MMMKIRGRGALLGALAALLVMILGACADPVDSDDDDRTLIRLENTSAFELTNVSFSSGREMLTFDRIAPGARTEYVEVRYSYRYGFLRVTANGSEHTFQPIDFVGEEEIGPGRFTFRIFFTDTGVNTSLRREN